MNGKPQSTHIQYGSTPHLQLMRHMFSIAFYEVIVNRTVSDIEISRSCGAKLMITEKEDENE